MKSSTQEALKRSAAAIRKEAAERLSAQSTPSSMKREKEISLFMENIAASLEAIRRDEPEAGSEEQKT